MKWNLLFAVALVAAIGACTRTTEYKLPSESKAVVSSPTAPTPPAIPAVATVAPASTPDFRLKKVEKTGEEHGYDHVAQRRVDRKLCRKVGDAENCDVGTGYVDLVDIDASATITIPTLTLTADKPKARKPRAKKSVATTASGADDWREVSDLTTQRDKALAELADCAKAKGTCEGNLNTCAKESGACKAKTAEQDARIKDLQGQLNSLKGDVDKLKVVPLPPAPAPATRAPRGRRTAPAAAPSAPAAPATEDLTPFTTKSRGANPQ
ncbi:hypothetical protein A3H11_01165 [Candidatus Uhrbacteria bacterium RIFCSPLOWO2_12_FULL_47_10]|nr:MAG: hypothetical protein A3H11_01165 [Candidatus Uhrbacteria bacterium RIFCSPLOWO2_12_FULL_47_10]